jgi:hypothetical protein
MTLEGFDQRRSNGPGVGWLLVSAVVQREPPHGTPNIGYKGVESLPDSALVNVGPATEISGDEVHDVLLAPASDEYSIFRAH